MTEQQLRALTRNLRKRARLMNGWGEKMRVGSDDSMAHYYRGVESGLLEAVGKINERMKRK